MRVGAVILALGVVTSCHHNQAAPASAPAPAPAIAPGSDEETGPVADPKLAADIAAGFEEVLATMASITEAADDCPLMATKLRDLFQKSAPLFELARAQGGDAEAARMLKAELDKRAIAVEPLVTRIQHGLERCKMDPDVAAAMEHMPTL
jgi:hypothetical protein